MTAVRFPPRAQEQGPPIPEPGTLALLGTAGMGLLPLAGAVVQRKRRRSV